MASIDAKTVFKNIVIGLLAAWLFFSMLTLSYSWIKLLIVSLFLVCGVVWLVSHGKLKKALKYLVLSLMVFGICFTSFESYVFSNAGYPSTYNASTPDITLSYPSILNVSLTELVQGAKATNAFSLFDFENNGGTTFESILLSTTYLGGRIEIIFRNEHTNLGIGFVSTSGFAYHTSVMRYVGQLLSQTFFEQTPEQALVMFDSLGLEWFYNQVSEEYQNRTGTNPNITSLDVSTQWQDYGDYRGMTLLLSGWQKVDNKADGIFHAEFQPNGTLLYLTTPTN